MTTQRPLADRMRPKSPDEILGQTRWLGPGAPLRVAMERAEIPSVMLWGPPGCGKTTIAECLAESARLPFVRLSAVFDGIKQIRKIVDDAQLQLTQANTSTLLFVDEIHRWNKAQQDALLPHVESGRIVLVGATTENPSFEVIPALRSRMQVVRLTPLSESDILHLLRRALATVATPEKAVECTDDALVALARAAGGDEARGRGAPRRVRRPPEPLVGRRAGRAPR